MAEKTGISWATSTFNPCIGCTKVAAGCQNCYAEAMTSRLGVKWGPNGTRRRTAESTWKQVERWNRQARCTCGRDSAWGVSHIGNCPQKDRPRVFPSLCDPFEMWDGPILNSRGERISHVEGACEIVTTMDDVRRDFFALIDRTQNLDWLLLTKRPENIRRMWFPSNMDALKYAPTSAGYYRKNVWIIYSASDQNSLDAGLSHLCECRDLAPVIGLSLEPLIGPVDLKWMRDGGPSWVIVGGESGPRARPSKIKWYESIAEQCKAAGVPLWVKQYYGPRPGEQGLLPDWLWNIKELPK